MQTTRATSAEIDDAAAAWAARVDRAPLPEDQDAAFELWLAADIRHRGAYARARAIFLQFDAARAAELPGPPPAIDEPATPLLQRRALLRGAGGAVALAACVGAGIVLLPQQPPLPEQAPRLRLMTMLGEMRRAPLPDGSTATLNTASIIDVAFTANERRVILVAGEALFDVAKDPARPFVVQVDGALFQAVGTSFTIRRDPGRPLQMLVSEGVVQVTPPPVAGAVTPPPVRVEANRMAELQPDRSVRVETLSLAELQRRAAWQQGMIALNDDTLEDAAREFQRYSTLRILFEEPSIGRRRVAGLFAASNPAGFAKVVATSLGLKTETIVGGIKLVKSVKQ